MREKFILHGKKIELFSSIVFLKKTKKKEIVMDGKKIIMTFPRGKYGISGFASLDNVVTTLYLNPSIYTVLYGYMFNLRVKPEEVSLTKLTKKTF